MDFQPTRSTVLTIDDSSYQFMPHPYFLDEVYAQEGGEAVIYQVSNTTRNVLMALKVTKSLYRGAQIARAAAALAPYKDIAGLRVGERLCLTKSRYAKLIAAYPDLEYAILMPWLSGHTWAGFLLDRVAATRYMHEQGLALALATAHVLWDLESHHLTHTDIAGGNIIIAPDTRRVELLDIESLYAHGASVPKLHSMGSPGYQQRKLDQRGQCRPEGDRFAGAILLAEMLSWWSPQVRALTPNHAESLFQPLELQITDQYHPAYQRLTAVRNALYTVCPPALALFDQAWTSPDLAQCPDLSSWAMCLIQGRRG